MVAQIEAEVFHHTLCTPERDPFDSEELQLAVETARGLEGEGDFAGAVQWLRRAVRAAEKQGNVVRAEDLARASEELAEKIGPWEAEERIPNPSSPPDSSAIADDWMQVILAKEAAALFAEFPEPRSERSGAPPASAPASSIPPMLAALVSSMPPFSRRASAEIPPPAETPWEPMPLPASPPPTAPSEPWSQLAESESWPDDASASGANDNLDARTPVPAAHSMVVCKPLHAVEESVAAVLPRDHCAAEGSARVSAFRVAIPVSGQRSSSFFIQQLASGQRAPAGMVEAMIVVTGESDSTIGFETSLGVAKAP